MFTKFTDNLNLGEAANTTQDRNNKESCEEEQKKVQRDSAQEIVSHAGNRGNLSTRNNRSIQHYRRVTIQLNSQPYIVRFFGFRETSG